MENERDDNYLLQKVKIFKEKGWTTWQNIYTILTEVDKESIQKKRWILLDHLHSEVSALKSSYHGDSEMLDSTLLREFTKIMCELYFSYILCSRTNQRIIKVINVIHGINAEVVKATLSNKVDCILSEDPIKETTLLKVFIIIDSWILGRSCIEDKLDPLWLQIMGKWSNNLQNKLKESTCTNITINFQETLQLIIKTSLQMFQHFPTKIQQITHAKEPHSDQAKKDLTTVVSLLTCILFSKNLAKECLLLSGTSLSLFVNIESDNSQAIDVIYQILQNAGVGLSSSTLLPKKTITVNNLVINLPAPDCLPLTQITLLQAFITSSKKDIILHMKSDKDKPFLIDVVFITVYQLCRNEKNPVIHYLSHEAVKSWMQRVQSLLKDIHDVIGSSESCLFGCNSYYTNSILELVWDSMEDPVEGVPLAGRVMFGLLVDVHGQEQNIIHDKIADCKTQFYDIVLDKVLGISWQVKARYGLLCELLPFVSMKEIFNKRPTLLYEMAECLKSNHLSPACTEVFKAFLLKSKHDGYTEFQKNWIEILLKSLASENQLLAQHTRQYWLPCALKTLPETLDQLLHQLSSNHRNACHSNLHISAQLAILKVACSLGIIDSSQLDEVLLKDALEHEEDNLRLEALGVLSSNMKTSKPLADIELNLLREFLPHSLNIACPSFRQELFVDLKRVLCRIRDSSLYNLKKSYPKVFKKTKLEDSDISGLTVPSDIKRALEFIGWMFKLLTNSLLPGANYQRQKTALELLSLMFDTFAVSENPNKKKGQAPESSRFLMMLSEQKGLWSFYSSRNVHIFLGCLQSFHSDIREMAFDVLRQHFSSPFKPIDEKTSDKDVALDLIKEAKTLICSPKVQECESGSILCQLLFERYTAHLEWRFTEMFCEPHIHLPNDSRSTKPSDVCIQFLIELVSEAERQLSAAQNDLSLAAEHSPIHGILLTLCRCLSSYLDFISSSSITESTLQSFHDVIQRTVTVAIETIDFVLGVLSKKHDSQDVVCGASFAGLGEAVNDAISTSDIHSVTMTTSQQHKKEFIISCCFLSIKSACHLLSSIVEKTSLSSKHVQCRSLLTSTSLAAIGEAFIKIFTQCRLMGVLLSCKTSLMVVSRCLSESPLQCLYSLPRRWIENVINSISGQEAASSVTRRSAGLPVLVVNILASESPNKRPLTVKYCLDELLRIACLPIPDVIDQTTDLPQVHAMNILRLLYQDTALGNDVFQFTEQGFILAVKGFTSPLWSIRNAATQLFGSLVLRTLGHKRGYQDENQLSSISAKDFFKRFSSLHSFFLEQLNSFSSSNDQQVSSTQSFLRPELFPILTLFAKLRPATCDAEENLLADFIPALTSLSSNPVHAVRVLAAQALVPFIPIEKFVCKAVELVRTIPCTPHNVYQNRLHGTLLQIRRLVDAMCDSKITEKAMEIMNELQCRSWLGTQVNACAVTSAEYLILVMELSPLTCDQGNDTLKSLVRQLTSESLVNDTVIVGLPCLQRARARAALDVVYNEHWSKDLKDFHRVSVIRHSLCSVQRETRIATLERLNEFLQKGHDIFIDGLDSSLTSLITMETDQYCLLLALECFNNVYNHSAQVHFEDYKTLWNSLLSYTKGSRGSTVQSKATTALSILLRSILRNSDDPPRTVSLAADWSELVNKCSFPNQPEPVRSGAAKGLGIAGVEVLLWAEKFCNENVAMKEVVDTSVRVFFTGVMLLEDEQDDVRITASRFAAKIRHRHHNDKAVKGITCSVAMKSIFEYMSRDFYWSSEVWVAMVTIIRGRCSVSDLLSEYVQARRILFEQEDCNLYAEPFVTAQLSCKHLKIMAERVSSDEPVNSEPIRIWCQKWLQTESKNLNDDLETLKKADIKDGGSLQNPKLFTLRYRLVMMTDVIRHLNSSLGNPVSSKITNDVLIKQMQDVLWQVNKTSTGCHPILYELAVSC